MRYLQPEERDEIARLYQQGLNVKEVAKTTRHGKRVINKVLDEMGLLRYNRVSKQKEAPIIADYQAGLSQLQISKKYNCTRNTVRKVLRRNNIPILDHRGCTMLTLDQREALRTDWRSGMECREIMIKYDLSRTTLNRYIKLLGEALRRTAASGYTHGNWKGGRIKAQSGDNNYQWKGGRAGNGEGYFLVRVEADDPYASMRNLMGYVLEHRLVMARHIGRPLTKDETVHHINGNRGDNRIENLQLRVGKHGSGQAFCCADCGSFNVVPVALMEIDN